MMHFYVKSLEPQSNTVFEQSAILQYRLLALDYLAALYADKKLGFYFRSEDGLTSHELHRVDSLEELDGRLKANPQWPYCKHEVIPVTKTGTMVQELASFLGLDPNTYFTDLLAQYETAGIFTADGTKKIRDRLIPHGGDFIALMSADEEEIDEAGIYTAAAKASKDVAATVSEVQLRDMWERTLRSQVAHLNSDVEFVDYNPVGRSEGLLIGRGPIDALKALIESTEIYPDTIVRYHPLLTPTVAAQQAADELKKIRRTLPALANFKIF